MDDLLDILKIFLKTFVIFFAVLGLFFFFFVANDVSSEIEYYENNIKIDAIKYHNEIYLKKGE